MAITVLIPLASPTLIQCGQVLESASVVFPFARLIDVKLSHIFTPSAIHPVTQMDFRACYAPDLCISINVDAPPVTELDAAKILSAAFSKLAAAMVDKSANNGKALAGG